MNRYDIDNSCGFATCCDRRITECGDHVDAEVALAEIAKRDKRIAELEAELARLHAADSSCPYCGEAYE